MNNITTFLQKTDPKTIYIVIGIALFFLLPAIFLDELKRIRSWLELKMVSQKLENYIELEEKPMENKKYTFWTQLGMGIKWFLVCIGLGIILTVLTEAVKILK